MTFEWPWTSDLPSAYIIRPSEIHLKPISYLHLSGYFDFRPIRTPDMQSHTALTYFHISSFYRKWVSFFKFTVYIVKIDKKQNPLKSISENGSSLPQCIYIVCPTPVLVCGGGSKVSKHPVEAKVKLFFSQTPFDYYGSTRKRECLIMLNS